MQCCADLHSLLSNTSSFSSFCHPFQHTKGLRWTAATQSITQPISDAKKAAIKMIVRGKLNTLLAHESILRPHTFTPLGGVMRWY